MSATSPASPASPASPREGRDTVSSPTRDVPSGMSLPTSATPPPASAESSPPHDGPPAASSTTPASDLQATPVVVTPGREPEPFDLLRLPPELRLMVYEAVDFTHHHYVLPDHDPNGNARWKASNDVDKTIVMARLVFSFDLLATSKQINAEARPIFEKKLLELQRQPVKFHVGDGAAFILTPQPPSESTDSPLIHCFDVKKSRWHKLSDSPEMTAFVARSASFIEYCQAATGKAQVEIIVDTPDHVSGIHCYNEVVPAVEGAVSLAAGWYLPAGVELDVAFIFFKQLPDYREYEQDPLDSRLCSGKRLEKKFRQDIGNQDYTPPNGHVNGFRFKKVKSKKVWAKFMKNKE